MHFCALKMHFTVSLHRQSLQNTEAKKVKTLARNNQQHRFFLEAFLAALALFQRMRCTPSEGRFSRKSSLQHVCTYPSPTTTEGATTCG